MPYKVECKVYSLVSYKDLIYFLIDFDTEEDAIFETPEEAQKRIDYEYEIDEPYDSGREFKIVEIN